MRKEVQEEKKETEKELEKVQEQLEQEEKEVEEQNVEELKSKLKGLMTTTESKNKVKEYMKLNSVKSVKDLSVEQLEELIGLLADSLIPSLRVCIKSFANCLGLSSTNIYSGTLPLSNLQPASINVFPLK